MRFIINNFIIYVWDNMPLTSEVVIDFDVCMAFDKGVMNCLFGRNKIEVTALNMILKSCVSSLVI